LQPFRAMTPAMASGLLVRRSGVTGLRSMGGSPAPWNYLWKPAAYADTDEKRIAAAKKYGMLLEDYKQYDPVTEMDVMAGDYPKLPESSAMEYLRDPYYPWDIPQYRRNYGEPLHENWHAYRETRFTDMDGTLPYTRKHMLMFQILWFFMLYCLWRVCEGDFGIPKMTRPVGVEQLTHGLYKPGTRYPSEEPFVGVRTWYTFEVPKEE